MPQENQQDRSQRPQDERSGGYGDDAGRAEEAQAAPDERAAGSHGDSAVGRENPAASSTDGDEALGNRVGGYGRGAEEEETD